MFHEFIYKSGVPKFQMHARQWAAATRTLPFRPINPSPARTGTSRPARPGPACKVGRPAATQSAAGPAGTTLLLVGPSGSWCASSAGC